MLQKWWALHLSNSWCVITPDSLIEKSMLTAVVALQQCAKASHALDVAGTASQAACASVVSGNPKAWTGAAESGRAPKLWGISSQRPTKTLYPIYCWRNVWQLKFWAENFELQKERADFLRVLVISCWLYFLSPILWPREPFSVANHLPLGRVTIARSWKPFRSTCNLLNPLRQP